MAAEYGIRCDPDTELIITLGVSQGLDLALRSILNPGDEVIVVEPCYVSYAANVTLLHGVPVIVPTYSRDGFRIDLDLLKKSITKKTKALLLNYPANPTGATIDRQTLEEISALALKYNFIVLSDEIYCTLTYGQGFFLYRFVSAMIYQGTPLQSFAAVLSLP